MVGAVPARGASALRGARPRLGSGSRAGGAEDAAQDQPPEPALTEAVPSGREAVLTYVNRPITILRARVLLHAPDDRVAAARQLLDQLVDQGITGPVTTVVSSGVVFIRVGGHDVLNLVAADLNPLTGETLDRRASEATDRLSVALAERQELRLGRFLWSGLRAGAATLFVAFLIALLVRTRGRAEAATHRVAHRRLEPLSDLAPIPAVWITRLSTGTMTGAFLVAGAFLTYWWLGFVLRQFPYTRPWGETLREYLIALVTSTAFGVANAIPGLFFVALVIGATKLIVSVASSFFDSVERGHVSVAWASADTARASRWLTSIVLWLFAVIIAYPFLPGSGTDAFKGIGVFVGLIVSFGSSGFVNQLMSGLTLIYSHALRVGDVIQTGNVEGEVTRMGPVSIQVHTFLGEQVTIPNSVVIGQSTTNYTRLMRSGGMSLGTEVTIGYGTPWRQVSALLWRAAQRTNGVLSDPPPRVVQRALEDFYVRYRLIVSVETHADRAEVLTRLLGNIQDAFNEFGVQIMSPNYQRDPHTPQIVPPERWYDAPAVAPEPAQPPERSAT